MISSKILKAVESGKTINAALTEAYESSDSHFNYQLNSYLDDYADGQKAQEQYYDMVDDYEDQTEKFKKATNTIQNFLKYPGDLIADSELMYNKQDSDDDTDSWCFIVRDEDLDAFADELIEDFSSADFDYDIHKYFIYVYLVVKKGDSVDEIKAQVSEYNKSGKNVKTLVEQFNKSPFVQTILFDWDSD